MIAEYRKKGDTIAYHFNDACDCDDDLKALGVKNYAINVCNYHGVERITLSIVDDCKNCLATAILGDYIIRQCHLGKLSFAVVPQERFEQEYEYVQDITEIDDDCVVKSMKDLFERK